MASEQADHVTISSAKVSRGELVVCLSDGRSLSVPLSWYPRLADAPSAALEELRVSPFGVHWDDLDEDVGLTGMLSSLQATGSVTDRAA